jgi:D-glycero-D-manno-heptose 1,7-bisphosphate phosphatase
MSVHSASSAPAAAPRVRLVILDRDGVLNEDRLDYVKSVPELIVIPGAAAAVARLNAARIPVAVATNQSCIGKGLLSEAALEEIHAALEDRLNQAGGWLDTILFCPDNYASPRRKPAPGMLLEAMALFGVPPQETVFIGDALRDLQAAASAGCRAMLVRTGQGRLTESELGRVDLPVTVHDTLALAIDYLLMEAG